MLGKLIFIENMLAISVLSTSLNLQMRGDFIKEVIITLDMAQQEGIMMIIYYRNISMYMVS